MPNIKESGSIENLEKRNSLSRDRFNKFCLVKLILNPFIPFINKQFFKKTIIAVGIIFSLLYLTSMANAGVPEGPTIDSITNETREPLDGTLINTSGGSITTMVLNTTAQNTKWKAFVGNVSGKLVLAGADNYAIYDWTKSSIAGNVYATRKAETVSWNRISCANLTHIRNEEIALNHTSNPDDNISATFNTKDHDEFYVATKKINQNSCYSIMTNVMGQKQSGTRYFQEILLYDGLHSNDGYIVYATKLEEDVVGYNNKSYDFQMIVPEVALSSWTSSTGYYFYVEII